MATPNELRVLVAGPVPDGLQQALWTPTRLQPCDGLDAAAAALRDDSVDAVLLVLPQAVDASRLVGWPALSQACLDAAVLVVTDAPTATWASACLDHGVQDVLATARADAAALASALHMAIGRKSIERAARKAYATDLATGLPNQTQLLEHMSHLLALREREPAPMALLVIRIDGLATAEARLGVAGAGVLRRKLAVRLRASLRASDVVASVGSDAFAALLAWIDVADAAQRVAAKLERALHRPVRVGGEELAVAVRIGLALYPEHGKDAQALLRRAFGQSTSGHAIGRDGFANFVERGSAPAANEDSA